MKTHARSSFILPLSLFLLLLGVGAFGPAKASEDSPKLRAASAASLRIGTPERLANGWKLTWSSVAGKTYKLQKLSSDSIQAGTLTWVDVQTVNALGGTTAGVDTAPAGTRRFYRVVQVEQVVDSQLPTVGGVTASPSTATVEGNVTLTVLAQDNTDVVSVAFFDGATLLGSGARGEGDAWRFLWPLQFAQNGAHRVTARATDLAGNSATSAPLTFTAAITNQQVKKVVGLVPVNADSFTTNGTTIAAGNNLRLGNATLAPGAALNIGPAQNILSGSGTVSLPGIGPVYSGPFQLDTTTGWLSTGVARQGLSALAAVSLPPIHLSSNVTVQATNLSVNVLNQALAGSGAVVLKIGDTAETIQFDGAFSFDYQAFLLTIEGKCTYKGISTSGHAVLNLARRTFEVSEATISITGTSTGPFSLTEGQFALTFATATQPTFTVGGKINLPVPITVTLSGALDAQGGFTLQGSGTGTLAGFGFDPLEAALKRTGATGLVSLSFQGGLRHAVGTIRVGGTIASDGTVSNLTSGVEDLNLGNGVRLLVENGEPILRYLENVSGVRKFAVGGGFGVPGDGVITAVHVSGTLELDGTPPNVTVRAFSAQSAADLNLTLPGSVAVTKAQARLGYGNGQFTARLGGEIALGTSGKVPFDAGLILQEADPQDIQIDATLSPSNLNLTRAYLFSSALRLEVKTKTAIRAPSGRLTISGNAGLLPRGTLPASPALTDFYLSGTNVTATLAFLQNNFTATLSSGTLNLPTNFTTRICASSGSTSGGPAVSITPTAPLTLTYSSGLASLTFSGGFDFQNLGFTIPGGGGAQVELCTARLLLGDTASLSNITGRLLIPQASGDFQITNGSMDLSGKFDFSSRGSFVLDQTHVSYEALRVTYDGANLSFAGTGKAAFPNGTVADVSVRYSANEFSFIGTQNRLDFGSGVVLVPLEPSAQNPMVQFTRTGGVYAGQIKGRLLLPNNQFVEMAGSINNTTLALNSTARVHLGDGVWLTPAGNAPVLQVVGNTAGNVFLAVAGIFQLPGKGGGVEQIAVAGDLHLTTTAGIDSFRVTNSTPNLTFSLAPNLVVRQGSVALSYENAAFRARIAGRTDVAATSFGLDAQLILNAANENDVRIDAALAAQDLNIAGQLYFFGSALRLQAQTKVGDRPEYTRLRAIGKTGLFAKSTPLSASPLETDFYLLVRDASTLLELSDAGFGARLDTGTMILPAVFSPGLCPVGTGPNASVTSANPLIITYVKEPQSLSFTGAINFQNLGLTVPDFPQLKGELCEAKLVFNGQVLPYLTNLAGKIQIPFPQGQTTAINIQNGAWQLDGYPTGTIALGSDLTLYDQGGFRFKLLSAQSAACPQGSSLTVQRRTGTQSPQFILNGGIEAGLPLDLISGVSGDRVASSACGSITFSPPDVAAIQVTDYTFAGSFHLGDLNGVTVNNARVTLRGVNNLFTPGAAQPFTIEIAGDLDTGRDVRFSLQNAAFTLRRLADGSVQAVRLAGAGRLGLPQNVTVDAALDFDIPGKALSFNSSASNLQLRIADDVVLFDAGFGFSINAQDQSGTLRASGSAGFFAKGALGTTVRRQDFYLIADGIQTSFAFNPAGYDLRFENGTLRLPAMFTAGLCGGPGAGLPGVSLSPQQPIVVSVVNHGANTPPSINFNGALQFANLGFRVPDFPDLAAELCSARLLFSSTNLPILTNLSGTLTVPIPKGEIAQVNLTNASWKLNGFPQGTILLPTNITAFSQGGFTFTILGGNSCGPNLPATSLTIGESQIVNGVVQLPRLEMHGGVQFKVDKAMLQNDSTEAPSAQNPDPQEVHGSACGSLVLTPDAFPRVTWDSVTIGGSFRIGSGIRIRGASLTIEGLENVFHQTESNPFIVRLGGTIDVTQGPAFGMQNTRFVFFDNNRLPRFEPGKFVYQQDDWDLPNKLPIVVREASVQFLDGSKSRLEELFAPSNVKVGLSATIAIPNAQQPYFSGSINDLSVTFKNDGTPDVSIDGFGFTLDPGMKIPPIEEIGGSVYVSGLQRALQDPTALFFTGRVAGSYQGYKLKFLLAFNLLGPIGMCLDVNAGSVGIPLAQTGFLISGASGGFSFVNNNADPCAFSTYMDADGKPISNPLQLPPGVPPFPIAVLSWSQLRDYVERFTNGEIQVVPRALPDGTGEITLERQGTIPCPGDCPPATVNIFCQPHPDSARFPGRIITKFTSIDEGTLNTVFGITEDRIGQLLTTSQNISVDLARMLRLKLDEITPDPSSLLGTVNASRLRQAQQQTFDTIEGGFRDILAASLGNSRVASFIYERLRDIVYAGLPCLDVTFKVSGTLTHLAVSSFLSITGEGTLSTTGSAGVAGKVNLLGVPVGIGKVFVAATDAQGLPNPSVCGDIHVTVGPLELGFLKASLACDECVSGVINIFANLVVKLSRPVIEDIIRHVAPQLALPAVQQDLAVFLNTQLSPVQKLAFMAELFLIPPSRLPVDLDQVILSAQDAVGLIIDRINPQLLMCGQVKPKVFGIPMAADYGSVQYRMNKFGRDATFTFSPSQMLIEPRLAWLIPPADNATFGYSEVFPNFGQAIMAALTGKLSSPEALAGFAKEQFASMLENSSMTAAYELAPMGFKLARAAARTVIPDLTNHPLIRQPAWVHPDLRGQGLMSQEQILQTAVRAQLLGNSLWKGNTTDLAQLFPEGSPDRQRYQNISLTKDYFPYGGIVGAGYLDIPRAFYETVPQEFFAMISPTNQLLQRLQAGFTYVSDYVLKNTEAGTLTFYIPAPNPPAFQRNGQVLSPQELLQSIMALDVKSILSTPLYPMSELFMQGDFQGKLLGVEVANGHMVAVLGNGTSSDALFRVNASLAQNAWVRQFVDQAALAFEIRQRPSASIEKIFAPFVARFQTLIAQNAADQAAARALLADFENTAISNMPKVSLEASVQNFRIPVVLSNYVSAEASGGATLYAYSPRFQPNATGTGPIAEARRRGGFAFKANLKFGNYFSVPNAELAVFERPGTIPRLVAHLDEVGAALPGGLNFSGGTLDLDTAVPALTVAGRMAAFGADQFAIEGPTPGAPLSAQLGSSGLTLSGARFRISNLLTNDLPAFTVSSNGDFAITIGPLASQVLDQFTITDLKYQVQRTNGVWAITNVAGKISVPNLGTTAAITSGSAASDGTFSFTGALGASAAVTGAPFSQVAASATVTLARTRLAGTFASTLRITGALSGGSLTGLPVAAGNVAFQVSSGGAITVNATVGATTLPLGIFAIAGSGGGPLSLTLNNSGLDIPNGAQLSVSGIADSSTPIQLLTLSQATIGFNGSFSASAAAASGLNVGGFSFPSITATIARTSRSAPATLSVSGALSDSKLPALRLSGSITNDGNLSLNATAQSGSIAAFPFGTGSLNFTLTKAPGGAGSLALSGSLNLPGISAIALTGSASRSTAGTSLTMSGNGAITLGAYNLGGGLTTLDSPANGVTTLTAEGNLSLPGFSAVSQHFTGSISASGNFTLTSSYDGSFYSFPIIGMQNSLSRGTANYAATITGDTPLAYWRLGELAGTTAVSTVNPAYNGTYQNRPTLGDKSAIAGDSNPSAAFNSQKQYVLIGNQAGFSGISRALTLEAWIKVAQFDAGRSFDTILSKGDSSWRLQRSGASTSLSFDTDGLNPPYLSGVKSVADGRWHHVAAVYDGAAKYLYVDGELDAWTIASGNIAQNSFDVLLGANSQVAGREWNGSLDEVAIYTRALDPGEVAQHFQAGGGTTLNTQFRVNLANIASLDLRGLISSTGAVSAQAGPASLHLGGFDLNNALLRFSRGSSGNASLLVEGDISVPGSASAHLAGSMDSGGGLDLSAGLSSGQLGPFSLNNLAFRLKGNSSAPNLGAGGQISVAGLGNLSFDGALFSNGDFNLTNIVSASAGFFQFPVPGYTNVIQRYSGSYSTAIAGSSLIGDFGANPIAYWRLGEGSGTVAGDNKKSSFFTPRYDGTYVNGVALGQSGAIPGDANTSARFDGVNDYISINSESPFDFTTGLTIEAWVKVASWTTSWQAIVAKGDSSWRLSRYSNTRQISFETSTAGGGSTSLPSIRAMDDGQWHHIVASFNGVAKYLYIDGALEAFAPYAGPINQNNTAVTIGENLEAPGRYFNGWMDEVALYNHALTPSEVLYHYQLGGGAVITSRLKVTFPGWTSPELFGGFTPSGGVALAANGSPALTLGGFNLGTGYAALLRTVAGASQLQVAGTLNLPALDSSPKFAGGISPAGTLDLAASNLSASLLGYSLDNAGFNLSTSINNSSSSLNATVRLNLGNGFPQKTLSGTISSANAVSLKYSGGFDLAGFAGSSGSISLDNQKNLSASVTLKLAIPNVTFSDGILFSGGVQTDGSYSFGGTGSLSIGGVGTTSSTFTVAPGGLSGSTSLRLANPIGDFAVSVSLTSSSIAVSGSASKDTGWKKSIDAIPLGSDTVGDIWARGKGTLAISSDTLGNLSGKMTSRFAIWEYLGPLHTTPPADLESANSPSPVNLNGSLNSSGALSFSYGYKGSSSWTFNLW